MAEFRTWQFRVVGARRRCRRWRSRERRPSWTVEAGWSVGAVCAASKGAADGVLQGAVAVGVGGWCTLLYDARGVVTAAPATGFAAVGGSAVRSRFPRWTFASRSCMSLSCSAFSRSATRFSTSIRRFILSSFSMRQS